MNKKHIITLFIILGIIFFITLLLFGEKKVYFSLYGDNYLELNIGEIFEETGFEAKYCNKYLKLFCKDISNSVKVSYNKKNNKLFVNYSLNYLYNNKVLTREIHFLDLESPNIELNNSEVVLCPNQKYIEEGFTVSDNVDKDLKDKVKINIENDKIYYSVSDSSGNSKVVFRKINYVDDESPNIILNDSNKVYIFKDREYIDSGYIATDNCDGDITEKVEIDNKVDTSITGEYKVTYTVSDTFGNKSTVFRDVIVYDDLSEVPKNGKIVYLTFDDGPGSYTNDILNVLDKYNIKATFFVTNQFSSYQELIKKEYEKGHTVAVHTYSHNYKSIYNSVDDYINDFNSMNQIIFEQTGVYSKIFRFPGGSSNTISKFNKGIMSELTNSMKELGYIYFDWNVDSRDTSLKSSQEIADTVINEISKNNYSVVLMHDLKKANIESVDKIISYGLENGYTFLPLDENSPLVHHTVNN